MNLFPCRHPALVEDLLNVSLQDFHQHLQITTKSMRRTSATHFFIDKSMQDLYEKIQNLSPQIVFKKYNHELVREKPSPCLSRAKSKNLPWLHYQHLQIATTSTHRTSATHFSSTDQYNTSTKRTDTFPYK